ncbi:polysaccharide biosynthesis protein [Marinomonas piezotolerans]|uniref:polysaccharide biosynthesis protein n=1 Tax=Marinomonas piezotolerans TaxID=2213058 RepID=UPI001FE5C93D|nr:polysaccharide biosynthesis protein [Marinomonas piezotolerans]
MFDKKSILITDSTRPFGKEYVETVIKSYRPARLIIFSRDEIGQEFDAPWMCYFIRDVRSKDHLKKVMSDMHNVTHAAVLEQIPVAEYNHIDCIKTNIHGAENDTVGKCPTCFAVVRYGNVAGSCGSDVPPSQKKIAKDTTPRLFRLPALI